MVKLLVEAKTFITFIHSSLTALRMVGGKNIKKFPFTTQLPTYVYLSASVFQLPFNQYQLPPENSTFSLTAILIERIFLLPFVSRIVSFKLESLFDSAHRFLSRNNVFFINRKTKPKCHKGGR